MKVHELKILPEFFDAVCCGDKRFEIRKNDRDFHTGDILRLKEWDGEKYTGEEIDVLVRYVLYDWTGGLLNGYCIMSIDTMMHSIPRKDAIVLLKEQQTKKSKDEVLTAIISTQGYTDAETFKRTVLEIDNFEDYFLGGLFMAVKAVEKLFDDN